VLKGKYDALVSDAIISSAEFALAQRSARRKNSSLEEVLRTEFQVELPAIGASLAKFFGVPYEPFQSERIRPIDLLKNLKRDYAEANHWLPIEETSEGVVVVTIDPERLKGSRMVNNIFPKRRIVYRVTTQRDFSQLVDQFFGALSNLDEGTAVPPFEPDRGLERAEARTAPRLHRSRGFPEGMAGLAAHRGGGGEGEGTGRRPAAGGSPRTPTPSLIAATIPGARRSPCRTDRSPLDRIAGTGLATCTGSAIRLFTSGGDATIEPAAI